MLHSQLISSMIAYYSGDPKRVQHFLKVYQFAKTIGELEKIDKATQEVLEVAAIVHDIGIKTSEEKYGSSCGSYQELEGPAVATPMLEALGYPDNVIERVCYLIGHHHTYINIDREDYQILVEADFLVNIYEDALPAHSIQTIYRKIFRTETGKLIFRQLYGDVQTA